MKLTRKLLSLFLVVLMIALSVPMALGAEIASGSCGANLKWTLNSSGTLKITGKGKMTDACVWEEHADKVKSVSLPSGLTSIGAGSFEHCENLTSVTIPKGVTSIGIQAFSYCKSLKSVSLPSSLERIGNKAFQYCSSLTSVEFPDGISEIEAYTFMGCTALRAIFLPKSVKAIRFNAFKNCYALKNVFYGGSEREWRQITIDDGNEVLIADDVTLKYQADGIGAITNPDQKEGNIFSRFFAFFRSLLDRFLSIFKR